MNILKSAFTVFMLLVFLATRNSIAYAAAPELDEYEDGDFSMVKEGSIVPYDGFLFDSEGLIKIVTNKNFQLDKLRLEKDSEIKKLNIELEYLKKQYNLELKIKEDIYTNILNIKDNRIQQLEDSKKWDDVKLFGSMLLGMALSVTIFYAAVQINK